MKRARFKMTSADGATRNVGIGGKMKTSEGDMIKIGIMGFAGAGKDTTADILWELHSKEKQSVALSRFAGHLKAMVDSVLGPGFHDRAVKEVEIEFTKDLKNSAYTVITGFAYRNLSPEYFEQVSESEHLKEMLSWDTISSRRFQQWVGTEIFRTVDPNIWVDLAIKMPEYVTKPDTVIFTDARYETEVDRMDSLIFVHRPGVEPVAAHGSEALAQEVLNMRHPKFNCKMSELKSSTVVTFRGKPMWFIYNAYSLSRLKEIVRSF